MHDDRKGGAPCGTRGSSTEKAALPQPAQCVACVASRPLCRQSSHLEPKQPKLK